MNIIQPVILAGGSGTRLWPMSREYYPKQFLSLSGNGSLLQQTLLRLHDTDNLDITSPIVVCNEEYRFLVAEHADECGVSPAEIILEPEGRNTAPALTLVALRIIENDPVLLVMPSDHFISDEDEFRAMVAEGYTLANESCLVTFGIKPERPETGYGYIKINGTDNRPDLKGRELLSFIEKPDLQTAGKYIESGEYLWNSGIFMMKASVWLSAIETYQPDILHACRQSIMQGSRDDNFFRPDSSIFKNCPSDSIDYAVMEKISNDDKFRVVVIPMERGWSDIGSWSAVWQEFKDHENNNNAVIGDSILEECSNTLVISNSRLVTGIGCRDLVIVETPDAVLVAHCDKTQDVRNIVSRLRSLNREEATLHRLVYRPWGSYQLIDKGDGFQVKRLTVKPGKRLSLQSHYKRAEHWVVVKGTAVVTRGRDTFTVKCNESTYIPVGEKHRLANEGDSLLEIIEVQSGNYLGEDDIVRYDDDFGRIEE